MILTTSLSPSYESCWTTKRDGPGGGRDVLTAVLADELARLAEGGVAVIVGTHDTNRVPEMVRGWGVRVLPDRQQIELCIAECSGGRTLHNLADNQQIAVTVVIPSTYRSVQFKGSALETSAPFPEFLERVGRHREAFIQEVDLVGVPRPLATRVFSAEMEVSPAKVKIRLSVDEIFDQTPGPKAGSRL